MATHATYKSMRTTLVWTPGVPALVVYDDVSTA